MTYDVTLHTMGTTSAIGPQSILDNSASCTTTERLYTIHIPLMKNSPYSEDYIYDKETLPTEVVADPHRHSRIEDIHHDSTASTSHTDHDPGQQKLHCPSIVSQLPPAYSTLEFENEVNKPGTHIQQEIIYPQNNVTLEETSSQCCNRCSPTFRRNVEITLFILFILLSFLQILVMCL